jgi:hypothetical protein
VWVWKFINYLFVLVTLTIHIIYMKVPYLIQTELFMHTNVCFVRESNPRQRLAQQASIQITTPNMLSIRHNKSTNNCVYHWLVSVNRYRMLQFYYGILLLIFTTLKTKMPRRLLHSLMCFIVCFIYCLTTPPLDFYLHSLFSGVYHWLVVSILFIS